MSEPSVPNETMTPSDTMDPNLTHDPQTKEWAKQTVRGMAYWAGTGPRGTVCGECQFFKTIGRGGARTTRCGKYEQMMNGKRGTVKLPQTTPSCKYFEAVPLKK